MTFRRVVTTFLALACALALQSGVALAGAEPAASKLNLNTATAEQLAELPGVGEKLAERIVEYRQKAGAFKSVEELMNVKGIGEKNFEKLRSRISVGETSRAESSR